jgi:hypothetical protein
MVPVVVGLGLLSGALWRTWWAAPAIAVGWAALMASSGLDGSLVFVAAVAGVNATAGVAVGRATRHLLGYLPGGAHRVRQRPGTTEKRSGVGPGLGPGSRGP